MFHHQATLRAFLRRVRSARRDRRGVILLVVLAMLALFTMIGLTLVLSTSQARLSALSSTRGQSTSTPYQQQLSRAFHEIARGSGNKYSPIQGHSLNEDLYGTPMLIGEVIGGNLVPSTTAYPPGYPTGTPIANPLPVGAGNMAQFFYYYAMPRPSISVPYILPNANFAYAGQLLTFTSGAAQNMSFRIVRDVTFMVGTVQFWQITIAGTENFAISPGDKFVINGRPFSGTGFGFQLTSFDPTGLIGNPIYGKATRLLDAMDPTPAAFAPAKTLSPTTPQFLWPYALLPNHAKFTPQSPGVTIPLGGGWYTDPGGPGVSTNVGGTPTVLARAAAAPGGANEPYDAVDFQNLFLAMHYFDVNTGKTLTPVPSFHRPELIAHWAQRVHGGMAGAFWQPTFDLPNPASPQPPALQQELRRKVIMRPEPQDQGFNIALQDMNGNQVFDYREPFTDLNTNGSFNGVYDLGEPFIDLNGDGVYTAGDLDFTGKRFNPITGPYYIQADVVTGSEQWLRDPLSDWDVDNDGDGQTDSIWIDLGFEPEPGPDGKLYKPMFAVLCVDMDGKLNVNAHGMPAHLDLIRYGGPAQGNFAGTPGAWNTTTTGAPGGPRYFPFGEGYGTPEISLLPLLERNSTFPTAIAYYQQLLQGKYVAGTPPIYINGRYGEVDDTNLFTPGTPNYPSSYLIAGPMPGHTQQFDPFLLSAGIYQVNDPINQMMQFQLNPYLINYTAQLANPPGYFFDFLTNPLMHVATSYGTPYNLHGRGVLLSGLGGQPYYGGTASLPWLTPLANPALGGALINDTVDDPHELNLTNRGAQRDGLIVGVNTNVTPNQPFRSIVDAPFTPEEVERVLRGSDVDTNSLPSRIEDLSSGGPSLASAGHRNALTSDSWDLPTPSLTQTDYQQLLDLTSSNYLTNAYNAPMATSLAGMSLVDLARARILQRSGATPPYTSAQLLQADRIIFGDVAINYLPPAGYSPTGYTMLAPPAAPPIQPLLAPELVRGLRMDLNRPLGNGFDDNGNGVVDEPLEILAEAMTFPKGLLANGQTSTIAELLDLNNDGFYTPGAIDPNTGNPLPADPYAMDTRARQLFARHLYVLMMLLIDDQGFTDYPDSVPTTPNVVVPAPAMTVFQPQQAAATGVPPAALLGQQPFSALNTLANTAAAPASKPSQQVAYLIAQWAVNVVDFYDADSIMTPFEFDLSPFTDDDGLPINGTWDVDDVIDPAFTTFIPQPTYTKGDDTMNTITGYRGLVWGCERPELLLTETIATHDRGTGNTNVAEQLATGMADDYYPSPTHPTGTDTDYDQVRRPRGSLFVELFNPNNALDAPKGDLTFGLPNGSQGVNLAQVVQGKDAVGNPVVSPVWRLAIAYSPSGYDAYIASDPGYKATGPTVYPSKIFMRDPRVPTLDPLTPPIAAGGLRTDSNGNKYQTQIFRAVYFIPATYAGLPNNTVPSNYVANMANSALFPQYAGLDVPPTQSFYADPNVALNANLLVGPNQYAIVGPGAIDGANIYSAYLGLRGAAAGYTSGSGQANNNPVHFELGTAAPTPPASSPAAIYNSAGSGPYSTGPLPYPGVGNIQRVVGVPIVTNWIDGSNNLVLNTVDVNQNNPSPAAHANVVRTLRMSVSEPLYGYPRWPIGSPSSSLYDDDFYYTDVPAGNKFPQHPFDSGMESSVNLTPNPYVAADGSNSVNMTTNYTAVYLQRLANPLQMWDPNANPYIVVDSMDVDLTAYTGENSNDGSIAEPKTYGGMPGTTIAFDSRRRGINNTGAASADAPNIWTPVPTPAPAITTGSVASPMPTNTFGYLNSEYGAYYHTSAIPVAANPAPVGATGPTAAQYDGAPVNPFPWLPWNNRPFVSQYELMLVPASAASSLLSDFGLMYYWLQTGYAPATLTTTPYLPPDSMPTGYTSPPVAYAPFHHLLNYYDSEFPYVINPVSLQPQPQPRTGVPSPMNFFRVFEYLHVPSRFVGTQTMLNPQEFTGNIAQTHSFHPPFNWLSGYREPGKINLNTVFDPVVFQGLMDDEPAWPLFSPGYQYLTGTNWTTVSWQSLWQNFIDTRRGFGNIKFTAAIPTAQPFGTYMLPNLTLLYGANQAIPPAYAANPLRPEGAGTLVPPMIPPAVPPVGWVNGTLQQGLGQGINATVLRPNAPQSYAGYLQNNWLIPGTLPPKPLFDTTVFDPLNRTATYANGTGGFQARQAARNAYFEYQTQSRLGNLTTNRSNVYAIWITVGYFEAVPTLPSAANPDGYQIGSEKGSETGAFERHRAFYMFDRSVPMGFMRGEDLNVDNGILIERMIE